MTRRRRVARRTLRWLAVVVLIVLSFRYIVRNFIWSEIVISLRSANLWIFFLGTALSQITYWSIRAWRWRILTESVGASRVNLLTLYLGTAYCLSLAAITPFQSGEALKVEILGGYGLRRFDGYSCFAIERVLDLFSVVLLAVIGIAFNAATGPELTMSIALMAGAAIVAGAGVGVWWAVKYSPWKARFRPLIASLVAAPGRILLAGTLSLAGWGVIILGWQCCLVSIGIHIPFIQTLSLTATITLVNVLSLVPGAVGVSEAGISMVLSQFGQSAILAQTGAVILRGYGLVSLALGLIHFIFWRTVKAGNRNVAPVT